MLPFDPILPQFETTLNAAAMREYFRDALTSDRQGSAEIKDCVLHRFRYRKSTRAIMLYELQLTDPDRGQAESRWVSVSIFKGGKAKKIYDLAMKNGSHVNGTGDNSPLAPIAYLGDLEALVQRFPYDRHLPQLKNAMAHDDPDTTEILSQQFGPGEWICVQRAIEPVRYRPGVGATLRTTLTARDQASGAIAEKSAYLKIYKALDPKVACRQLNDLHEAAKSSGVGFHVVRPLGTSTQTGALILEPVQGRSVEDILLSGECAEEVAIRCAQALIAFHTCKAKLPRYRTKDQVLARARRAAAFLIWGCPHLEPEIDFLFHRIEETLEDADPHPTHLDLKADHIFFDSGAVCFIDMESCALADPVLDPAMLAARLDVMPDILPVCRDRTQRFADVFLDEYFSGVPKNWRACFPAAYKCAALKVALYFLQHQVDGWQDRVASTLVKAMRRVPE